MQINEFKTLMTPVFDAVADRTVDTALQHDLNARFPPDGELFQTLERACHEAIDAGWMCSQGEGGRRFGRVIEPAAETAGLSVDVVDLTEIVGPHHRHPNGEVCMVMPVDGDAKFCGSGAGWAVCPAGSDHFPTVSGGRALVLYLLPGGAIEFTGRQPA